MRSRLLLAGALLPVLAGAGDRSDGLELYTPLVADLDGDGITLSDPENGVLFDLRETGRVVRTAWPRGDALLVLDRDGDGRITHGGELFGGSLREDGSRWPDGFAALAALDEPDAGGNGDGTIDAGDAAFAKLALWRDTARDGASEPNELTALAAAGVLSIGLRAERRLTFDRHSNALALWGELIRELPDGALERRTVADVWLRIAPAESGGALAALEEH